MSSSYATNGDSINFKSLLGVDTIIGVDIEVNGPDGGYRLVWDRTNNKILAFSAGTSPGAYDQVANATNLSAVTAEVKVECL